MLSSIKPISYLSTIEAITAAPNAQEVIKFKPDIIVLVMNNSEWLKWLFSNWPF